MNERIQHIAATLKAARVKKGLSQRALAARARMTQNHISRIENGEVDLQASSLIELSRVLEHEPMLIPVRFVPIVRNLISENPKKHQAPMYQLDEDSEDE